MQPSGASVPQLGPYRLIRELGRGGMSVVHLAADPTGREVAVKVLRPHIAGDATGRGRLAREVRALRRVSGAHVAEVLDADVEHDPPYVVTRFVPGPALDEAVRRDGPMRGDVLARLAAGLADALAAVHAAGVVHRDLKPSNVLLQGAEPVVIDFGIARVADESRLTSVGLCVGTPGYLPPEVVAGAEATPAADIHAWAATVAYAATGRAPFGTGPLEVVLFNVTQGRAELDGVPDSLRPLLEAALARDPADRPTAAELQRNLADSSAAFGFADSQADAVPWWEPAPLDLGAPAATLSLSAVGGTSTRTPTPWEVPPPPSEQTRALTVAHVEAGPPVERWEPVAHPPAATEMPAALPAEPRRHPVLALGLLAMVAVVAALAPVLTAFAVAAAAVALRAGESAYAAGVARLDRRGPRRRDAWLMPLRLPWHLLRSVVANAFFLPLAALLAAPAVLGAALASGTALSRPTDWAAVPLAAAAALATCVLWLGPGGSALRRSTWRTLDRVAPTRTAALSLAAVLVFAVAAAAVVAGATEPAFWPLRQP
jgi:predicted Ser/Thr protein kinase